MSNPELFIFDDINFTVLVYQRERGFYADACRIVDRIEPEGVESQVRLYTTTFDEERHEVTVFPQKAQVFCAFEIDARGNMFLEEWHSAFTDKIELEDFQQLCQKVWDIAVKRQPDLEVYVSGDWRERQDGPTYQIAEDGSSDALGYVSVQLKTLRVNGDFR